MALRPALALVGVLVGTSAHADGPTVTDDTWRVTSNEHYVVDGGLVVGFPAALPTGLTRGIGGGFSSGCILAWGARASWTTATESTTAWTVTQSDVRLRLTGAVQHTARRATVALRLGLGATIVHETRTRNQGMRAGLTGSELRTTALATIPAAELAAVIRVHIAGPWALTVAGGPSIDVHDSGVHGGWSAELGVAWQP